jgi:ribonuclease P/MRP protein subunit POP5
MRFKNRYLLCTLAFQDGQVDQSVTTGLLFRTFQILVENQWGDFGAGALMSSLSIKYYNAVTGLLMLRASRDHYRLLWTALHSCYRIKQRPCNITCIHVGGTIRSCQKAALLHSRRLLLEADRTKAASRAPTVTPLDAATGAPPTPTDFAAAAAAGTKVEIVRAATVSMTLVPSQTGEPTEFRSAALAKELVSAETEIMQMDY